MIDLHNLSSLWHHISSPILQFQFSKISNFDSIHRDALHQVSSLTFDPFITTLSTLLCNKFPCTDNVESLLICSAMCLSFVTTLVSSTSMYSLLSTIATAHFSPI